MHRLLPLWLVISLLGYSSAWAMDLHGSVSGADQSVQQLFDLDDGELQQQTEQSIETDCDHCCHGMSHLIALSPNGIPAVYSQSSDAHRSQPVLFLSRSLSPDLRPPIA